VAGNCSYTGADIACRAVANAAYPGATIFVATSGQQGQATWSCNYTWTTSTGSGTATTGGVVQAVQSTCSDGGIKASGTVFPKCTPDPLTDTYCVIMPLPSSP
jgi:hypothetical protein